MCLKEDNMRYTKKQMGEKLSRLTKVQAIEFLESYSVALKLSTQRDELLSKTKVASSKAYTKRLKSHLSK